MKREKHSDLLPLGSLMPEFSLPSCNFGTINSGDLEGKGFLILFMCNHCPYVVGSIRTVNSTVKKWMSHGLTVVGINSNDPVKYPQDLFENMKEFAKEMELCFPYCFDETQEVARKFDAQCTPEAYFFNDKRVLIYHGGVVDNPLDATRATMNYLELIFERYFNGKAFDDLPVGSFNAEGCSIKWK